MELNKIRKDLKVKVVHLGTTKGMAIKEEILSLRSLGKTGTIVDLVPGHGGDVWFVKQDNGISAYCFNEIEKVR